MKSMRRIFWLLILCAVAFPLAAQEKPAAKPMDYNDLLPWAKKGIHVPPTAEGEAKAPFQIFDNLYYVGPLSASTYILKTDQGLILIDPTYDYTAPMVLDNIRAVGLNPKDVKYILITHGHWDHTAGIAAIQQATGAKVGMAAGDWGVYETPNPQHKFPVVPRDLVFKDGDVVELGNTTVKLFVTPGHTPGCLTMVYTVYDHGKPYQAMTLGGTGFNFPESYTKTYIASMKRMREIPDIRVLLPDHPQINDVLELETKLQLRQPGEPHPYVQSREEVLAWFDSVIKAAQEMDRLQTLAVK
jgi:metallo-beta-lactamase class B